jgi:flagellar basal-body rod protein FlgF
MIRGLYTGASGMAAQQVKLDAISNNLANVDTTGYKRDIAIHKSFPELLLRRTSDDGLFLNPLGSGDYAPIVGKIGTGVETNELFTEFGQGSLKQTENNFDFAIDQKSEEANAAFLCVQTPAGERYTRNGNYSLGKEGYLETKDGYPVLGEKGPIRVKANNFLVDKQGRVWVNDKFQDDPNRLVGSEENAWDKTVLLDTLKLVDFKNQRYLAKQGSSMWAATEESGPARIVAQGSERPTIIQGFTEAANVNPVTEMVQMIEVNRAYEANQKSIQSEDAMLGKLINEVVKL